MKKGIDRDEVVRLYVKENLSTVQVGKIVGLSCGAVGSILKHRGVALRSSKEGFRVRFPNGRFGSLSARWKGGTRLTVSGYKQLYMPEHPDSDTNGYIMEHRWVAEQKIGRRLRKDEVPHHVNGERLDNRPENLEIMTRSEHVKKHFDAGNEVIRLRKILDEHKIKY